MHNRQEEQEMVRNAGLLVIALLVVGCGTTPYKPTEYPLRDGLIAPIALAGSAAVSNGQPSKEQTIVYSYGGSKLASDLNSITQAMVEQTQQELQKAAKSTNGSNKTITLKVVSLVSRYAGFHWNSNIVFQAALGNGQTLDFNVPHTSGILLQDLNGCIAEGVMTLLNDARLKAYLRS
jgi:hypothetical protein